MTEYVIILALAVIVVIIAVYAFQSGVQQRISDEGNTHFRLNSKVLLRP